MSLIRMFCWNREFVFYVESEFLFDDLKRFLCYFAENNSAEKRINILLSNFKSHDFLIILRDGKWSEGCSFKYFLWGIIPVPPLFLYLFFGKGKIFLSNSLIIPKRT